MITMINRNIIKKNVQGVHLKNQTNLKIKLSIFFQKSMLRYYILP